MLWGTYTAMGLHRIGIYSEHRHECIHFSMFFFSIRVGLLSWLVRGWLLICRLLFLPVQNLWIGFAFNQSHQEYSHNFSFPRRGKTHHVNQLYWVIHAGSLELGQQSIWRDFLPLKSMVNLEGDFRPSSLLQLQLWHNWLFLYSLWTFEHLCYHIPADHFIWIQLD